MTYDIFDISNVRVLKEILKKKKWRIFILFYVFGQLSSQSVSLKEPMLFQNTCRDASREQDCWNLTESRVRTKKYALRPNAA